MQREVRRIRRSIKRRRKNKQTPSNRTSHLLTTYTLTDQEKHGDVQLFPTSPITQNKGRHHRKRFSFVFLKGALSLVLFVISFLFFKTDFIHSTEQKLWFEKQLTKEFPFATVNAWYFERFGHPLAFNPQNNGNIIDFEHQALPVIGEVSEPFHLNGEGIKISSDVATPVKAWQDGIVIFSGNDRTTKKTVTIQHADKSETSYGLLSTIDVHLYQYVRAGQAIGMFHPDDVQKDIYFSIEKDDSFIDPVQVIYVDER